MDLLQGVPNAMETRCLRPHQFVTLLQHCYYMRAWVGACVHACACIYPVVKSIHILILKTIWKMEQILPKIARNPITLPIHCEQFVLSSGCYPLHGDLSVLKSPPTRELPSMNQIWRGLWSMDSSFAHPTFPLSGWDGQGEVALHWFAWQRMPHAP